MAIKQRISPFLWFNSNAEEAVAFYTGIFKDSKVLQVTRYGDAGPGPKGSVMTISFQLENQEFIALNGGPEYRFTEAISLVVNCENQKEVDEYWSKLTAGGGQEVQCGWLKDKFGLSWQVTPTILYKLIADPDAAKANRVFNAMLQMVKIDVARLEQAYKQ